MNCELCSEPISGTEFQQNTVWKEVTGWVGGPKSDSMRLRQDTGRYAHDECIRKEQAGIAPDQPDLFEGA